MGCCGVCFHWFSLALASILVVLACVCCGVGSGSHFSFGGEKYWGGSKFKFDITTWEDYRDVTDEFISRYFSFCFQLLAIVILIAAACTGQKTMKLIFLLLAVILIAASGFLEGWAARVFDKADEVYPQMMTLWFKELNGTELNHDDIMMLMGHIANLVGVKYTPDYLVVVTWVISAIFCSAGTVFVLIAMCTVKFMESPEIAPDPNAMYPSPQGGTVVNVYGSYDQPPKIAS